MRLILAQPLDDLANATAELLLRRLQAGKNELEPKSIQLEAKLLLKETTAAPQ